jgi:8-oxo-dGTP pyrophosphatase MutT (NUDIX family)
VRSDLHGWELPGGNAYPGENDEEVLEREVREETGLRVEIESRVGDYRRTGFAAHTARVFACRVRGGVLRPSSETPIVAWFDPEDLPETLFPWYRVPIADALARLPQPVARQEHLGLASVLAGMWIDVRMRSSNLRAGQVTGRR